MPDAVFGPLITGADVERAALATLQEYLPEYRAWALRKTGVKLPEPQSWVTAADLERWPEETPPSILLLSTGLADDPQRDGSRMYRAKFALGIAAVVSARTRKETDEMAKVYTATLRALLLHKQSLGGFADAVEWLDERYDVLQTKNRRQLAAGQGVFRIDVRDVVAAKAGPSAPRPNPTPPYPDPPTATSVSVRVIPEAP